MAFTVVTGGSRGIGLQLCQQLVRQGRRVILAARDPAAGQAAADGLRAPAGAVRVMQLDLSSAASISAFVRRIGQDLPGQVDVLVNNAGVLPLAWSSEAWSSCTATNVTGPVTLAQQLLPHMAAGAAVVMVSSGLGKRAQLTDDYWAAIDGCSSMEQLLRDVQFDPASRMGQQGYAPVYCVSKAMLNKAVRLLAEDAAVRERGACVVAVCPGWCRTDMGGARAERSAEQGAASVRWCVEHAGPQIHGRFFRDGQEMEW